MNPLLQQIRNTPLAGNIGSLLVIQLLNYAIPVVIIPVMIGALGDGGYGVFSYAQYFSALLMFVCDYGFAYTGPQQVSQNQENRVYLARIFSTITAIRFGLFIICSLITLVFAFAFSASEQEKHALLFSIIGLAGSVLLPNWFLQGAQKLRAFAVLNVVFKLMQVVLIWSLVKGKEDLELACLIFFGANLLLGIAAFVLALRTFGIGLRWPLRSEVREQLQKGYQMFLAVFFSSAYINGTGVILGMLTNDTVLGHYSAAEKIVRAVTYAFTPLAQAFLPFMSKMFVLNREMGKLLFFKFLNVIASLSAIAALVVYFLSGWLVNVLTKGDFTESILLVQILCPVILFGNLGNLLGNNLFIQLGWQKYTVRVMLLMAVYNTLGVYFLGLAYGANGAAIALCSTEILAPLLFIAIYRYKKTQWA